MFPTCSKQHVYGYIVSNKSLCLLYYSSVADLLPIPNALKLSWTLLSVKLSESCHDRNMLIFFWSPLLFLALSLFSLSIPPPPPPSLSFFSLSLALTLSLSHATLFPTSLWSFWLELMLLFMWKGKDLHKELPLGLANKALRSQLTEAQTLGALCTSRTRVY